MRYTIRREGRGWLIAQPVSYQTRKGVNIMPTLTEILSAVTDFVSSYAVFFVGGLVIGLAAWAISRLTRSGR
jgi:type II secretory pathway component PulF